jgi:putative transposase
MKATGETIFLSATVVRRMNKLELDALLARLEIPPAGQKLVKKAFLDAPVRDVKSNGGNVVSHFSSRKMDRHLLLESRTGELPAAVVYENDPNVLAFLAQPTRLDLILTDGGLKAPYRVPHTPDLLIIRADSIILEEWHPAEWLRRDAIKRPGRYVCEDGRWRWPEVEDFARARGIEYRLRTLEEHPRKFIRNIEFLADYLTPEELDFSPGSLEAIQACFADHAVISLVDLISRATRSEISSPTEAVAPESPAFSVSDIYRAVARKLIAFDLDNDLIDETHHAVLYRDIHTMEMARRIVMAETLDRDYLTFDITAGATITYDGAPKKVLIVGYEKATLEDEHGTTEVSIETLEQLHKSGSLTIESSSEDHYDQLSAISALTPAEVERANARARALELYAAGTPDPLVKHRTLQSWLKLMRDAGPDGAASNVSLAGRHRERGNRSRKIGEEVLAEIAATAKGDFNKSECISVRAAYKKFLARCLTNDVQTCSYRTFRLELKVLTNTRARHGKRMAYQLEPMCWYLDRDDKIHGVRPFQYVHIDHTVSDVELIAPDGTKLGRPILSLAVDADSRVILGFHLSFQPPSYVSCMMVLRDIARRHGRMPETIVVDNGKEFHSYAFKRFGRLYRINLRYRPAAQPPIRQRNRALVSHNRSATHSRSCRKHEGHEGRTHRNQVASSINLASWTLPALHGALEFYFSQLYGTENHPAHDTSPIDYFRRRLIETGVRRNRLVKFDRTFMIETCPEVERGTRVVDCQRGVKVEHVYYHCAELRKPRWDAKPVQVRVDPWDAGKCFVLLDKAWHECRSSKSSSLAGLSRVEMQAYFEEMRAKGGVSKQEMTPERIANWMKLSDPSCFDARLRAKVAKPARSTTRLEPPQWRYSRRLHTNMSNQCERRWRSWKLRNPMTHDWRPRTMARSSLPIDTLVPDEVFEYDDVSRKHAFLDSNVIRHPKMVEAYDRLRALTVPRCGTDIALLIGPTGSGKTSTFQLTRRKIEDEHKADMVADRSLVPVVYMEAPASGEVKYSWRYFYSVLGEAIYEPLMDFKREILEDDALSLLKPGQTSTIGAMRQAIDKALDKRRVQLVMIDEGRHLLSGCAGETLKTRMNGIKSLSNSKVRSLALTGSYDLFEVLTLNDQLARRATVIHLSRYRRHNKADEAAYRSIIRTFQRRVPIRGMPDLTGCADILMDMNVGLAGTLRDTLARAVTFAHNGCGRWKDEYLEDAFLTDRQIGAIMEPILEYEAKVDESCAGFQRRGCLWAPHR